MSSLKLRKEKDCLNCGHLVEDTYCPHCGQENIELKEDAWHMIIHAIADYFHFEHKFFGTIKPLIFKPGQLTVEYVAGKRASFLHPIKLYIFISIVFFILALSGGQHQKVVEVEKSAQKKVDDINKNKLNKNEDVTDLEQAMKYIPIEKKLKDSIIADAKKNPSPQKEGKYKAFNFDSTNFKTVKDYEKAQLNLPKEKRDNFLKNYLVKKSIEFNKHEDPWSILKDAIFKFIPKMMFVLLPLFALILKLVYWRKKKYYYEHLIYSFYTHSALFLAFILITLVSKLVEYLLDISDIITFLGIIYITWYIYRSLRTFYGSSKWVTVLKFFFLTFCYFILLTLGLVVIAGIGVILS